MIARQGTICQIEQGSSQVGRSSPLGSSLQKQTMKVLKHEAKSPRIGCKAKKGNLRLYTGLQSGNSAGSKVGSSKREGKITATAKARTAWEALKHDKTAGGKIKAWRHQNPTDFFSLKCNGGNGHHPSSSKNPFDHHYNNNNYIN